METTRIITPWISFNLTVPSDTVTNELFQYSTTGVGSRFYYYSIARLSQDVFDYAPMNIGQAIISSGVIKSQPRVIHS